MITGLSQRALRASGLLCLAAASVCITSTSTQASISGFGDFSGFSVNQGDSGSPPTVSVAAGSIRLTNTGSNEARSIFSNTPQSVGAFSASFSYQASNIVSLFGTRQGGAFVLQRAGTTSVGSSGEGVGYGGITPSLAIALQTYASMSATTLYRGGTISGSATNTAPLDLRSGDPINVLITYDGGSILHESLTDTTTSANYSTDYFLSPTLASTLGGSNMYVGLTAGTDSGEEQTFSNFQFTNLPEPTGLLAASAVGLLARRRFRK